MKKITPLLVVICIAHFCMAQNTGTLSKQDYLQKVKRQKTLAWVFLGSGVAMSVTGFAINWGQPWDLDLNFNGTPTSQTNKNTNKGMGLFYTGLVVTVSSIPIFIASGVNKRKARLTTKTEKVEPGIVNKSGIYFPAVVLQIRHK